MRPKGRRRFVLAAAAKSTAEDGMNLPELLSSQTSEDSMRKLYLKVSKRVSVARCFVTSLIGLVLAAPAFAQTNSPWENAVNVLQQAFTSTIARGLSLVAIVVSGLTFAFAQSRRTWPTPSRFLCTSNASQGSAAFLKSWNSMATTRMRITSISRRCT